ncbi:unnamed protein product [Adineta steineri]|uniref:Protein kinase domain-containing protein n=1 Tax=Adineta steineri TaxID=433720 RepID=A0A819F2N0_9BILA|nr:unnamed protein product [Adineta steineri]
MESLQKKTLNMNCLSKQSITHFEDLSNEIFYEIFGHLDYFHVYQSFFNLNIRFRKFLTCSNVLIKINISSISKSNLEHYYTNTIILYPHRIISLCITNKFCYDLHISPHHILSRFIRLETLILENIDTKYLSNTFRDISTLSNLSTLIITCLGYIRDANQYLLQLFRLPALKYCKVSLPERYQSNPLPFATNEYSPIEYLVIKHKVYLQNIDRLLSYIPQIRRLSLDNFVANNEYELNHPIMLNHLTHLFLKLDGLSFNNFKLLIKTFFSTIEVLHLSVYGKEEYINANQWQELILTSMPFLRVFNICVRSSISLLSMSQLNEFKSSFWHDRQWFFTHQGYLARSFYIPTFYSVNPYRQKKYIIRWDNKQFTDLTDTKTDHTSVNHVYITGERSIYRSRLNRIPSDEGWLQNQTFHVKGQSVTLYDRIGNGKFGSVWSAGTRDGQQVAVKIYDFGRSKDHINSTQRLDSFKTEIRMGYKMRHEVNNAVTVFGFDLDRQRHLGLLVMELGEESLTERVKNLHTMHSGSEAEGYDYITATARKNIWIQLVNIAVALKRNNIVHRDMKPANLVYFGSTLKIVDFGIALDEYSGQDGHRRLGGTHPFTAPECFSGAVPVTPRAEVWSVGAILYYLTYGQAPIYETAQPIPGTTKTRSSLVKDILHNCFQRNPWRRPDHYWLLNHPLTKSTALI